MCDNSCNVEHAPTEAMCSCEGSASTDNLARPRCMTLHGRKSRDLAQCRSITQFSDCDTLLGYIHSIGCQGEGKEL